MPAGKYDFTLERGSTFRNYVSWEDENDVRQSLTGYRPRMVIFEREDGKLMYDVSPDLSIVNDEIIILIRASTSATFPVRTAWYELYLDNIVDPSDSVRLLEGEVKIT